MKTKTTITIFLIFICVVEILAQNIFFSTSDNEIFRLNEDNSITSITSVVGLSDAIWDIAISPDNEFYGLVKNEIIKINILDGSFEVVTELPSLIDNYGFDEFFYSSLVCSNNYELFTLENETTVLYKYNILEDTLVELDTIGSYTPGDMTFYKGNLFIAQNGKIKAYNLQSKTLKTIFCLPSENYFLWGLANDFDNCDENKIISSNPNGGIWELNIETGVSDSILSVEDITIYGLASINENLASYCRFEFEEINCTTTSIQNPKPEKLTIYPNPTHGSFFINSNLDIKKVEIYDLEGKLNKIIINPFDEIDVTFLNSGFYFLKCYSKNEISLVKFVKL